MSKHTCIRIRAALGDLRVGVSANLNSGAGGRWKPFLFYFFYNHNLPISNQIKNKMPLARFWVRAATLICFFDDFFRFSKKCWILTIISSKTLRNEVFQTLGVLKNDYSWPKAAWSIFQSLFPLENRWQTAKNTEAEDLYLKKMAGNKTKRRALMCWSFSILNDDTKCLV